MVCGVGACLCVQQRVFKRPRRGLAFSEPDRGEKGIPDLYHFLCAERKLGAKKINIGRQIFDLAGQLFTN